MSGIKWIKLAANIFDNRKIKQIEYLPDGHAIIIVWLKLLCLAGNINDNGFLYFTKEMPYTDLMLANEFNMNLSTIQLALKTFEQFGMIEVINDILHISNWEKYQNVEGMEKIREQAKLRKRRQREREKLLLEDKSLSRDMSRDVTQQNKNKNKNKNIEKDIEKEKDEIDYESIISLYNRLCPSFHSIKKISFSRKEALKIFLKDNSMEDLGELFKKVEGSSFLKGNNERSWMASFDWIIKDENTVKILEGIYDDAKHEYKKNNFNSFSMQHDYDFDALEKQLLSEDQDFDEKRQQLQEKLKSKYGNSN